MFKLADSPSPVPMGPPSSTPTMVETTVPAASPTPGGDTLPKTGPDVALLVIVAAVLVLIGAAMMGGLRRLRAREDDA